MKTKMLFICIFIWWYTTVQDMLTSILLFIFILNWIIVLWYYIQWENAAVWLFIDIGFILLNNQNGIKIKNLKNILRRQTHMVNKKIYIHET